MSSASLRGRPRVRGGGDQGMRRHRGAGPGGQLPPAVSRCRLQACRPLRSSSPPAAPRRACGSGPRRSASPPAAAPPPPSRSPAAPPAPPGRPRPAPPGSRRPRRSGCSRYHSRRLGGAGETASRAAPCRRQPVGQRVGARLLAERVQVVDRRPAAPPSPVAPRPARPRRQDREDRGRLGIGSLLPKRRERRLAQAALRHLPPPALPSAAAPPAPCGSDPRAG